MPRVVIAAGGTGGHLYPAQRLAEQLMERRPDLKLLFVGSGLGTNRFFDRDRFAFVDIPAGRPRLDRPLRSFGEAWGLVRGVMASRRVLRGAQLVVGFGSFHTLPVLVAAPGRRLVLHAADAVPGKVLRFFSRSAELTTVQFKEAGDHLKGPWTQVRPPLRLQRVSKVSARQQLGLEPAQRTLLVVGGSQGAQSLNESLFKVTRGWQVFHLAGSEAQSDAVSRGYRAAGVPCRVKPFESQMHLAWQAADLAVMRAGAASIAEMVAYAVPAILVPYPFAAEHHQEVNADVIAAAGGGVKLLQSDLDRLGRELAACTIQRLNEMRSCLELYRKRPRRDLFQIILERIDLC